MIGTLERLEIDMKEAWERVAAARETEKATIYAVKARIAEQAEQDRRRAATLRKRAKDSSRPSVLRQMDLEEAAAIEQEPHTATEAELRALDLAHERHKAVVNEFQALGRKVDPVITEALDSVEAARKVLAPLLEQSRLVDRIVDDLSREANAIPRPASEDDR